MRIFITGATGFVGSFLAAALVEKNYSVRCLVRQQSNLRWISDLDVELYYGSLSDVDSLKSAVAGCDYVYHVAGLTKARTESEYVQANYEGTKNLVDACLQSDINLKRFVYISTQAAAGPSPTLIPIDEAHPPAPLTYYGKSKLAGEQYVWSHKDDMPLTIVRPPAVYGPRDTDILEFFRTVKTGIIPRLGGKDRYLSLIHVKDLVKGTIRAAESARAAGQIYYITSPRPYSWAEIAAAILKNLRKKGINVSVPLGLMKGVASVSELIAGWTRKPALINHQKIIEMEQEFWICSPDKARNHLQFVAEIDLETGIDQTIRWYKENKWL